MGGEYRRLPGHHLPSYCSHSYSQMKPNRFKALILGFCSSDAGIYSQICFYLQGLADTPHTVAMISVLSQSINTIESSEEANHNIMGCMDTTCSFYDSLGSGSSGVGLQRAHGVDSNRTRPLNVI